LSGTFLFAQKNDRSPTSTAQQLQPHDKLKGEKIELTWRVVCFSAPGGDFSLPCRRTFGSHY